jgi:hypothetical protein
MQRVIEEGKIYRVNLGDREASGKAFHKIDFPIPALAGAWKINVIEDDAEMLTGPDYDWDTGKPTGFDRIEYEYTPMILLPQDILHQIEDARFEDI